MGADDLMTLQKQLKILVVDDNVDSAESLGLLLELLGNKVEKVHDGLQAVDLASTFQPNVILMDLGLPSIDGYEAAKRIRHNFGDHKVVIIALTGWGEAEDRIRSKEAGCDYHFVKPIDLSTLEKLLQTL